MATKCWRRVADQQAGRGFGLCSVPWHPRDLHKLVHLQAAHLSPCAVWALTADLALGEMGR